MEYTPFKWESTRNVVYYKLGSNDKQKQYMVIHNRFTWKKTQSSTKWKSCLYIESFLYILQPEQSV